MVATMDEAEAARLTMETVSLPKKKQFRIHRVGCERKRKTASEAELKELNFMYL